MREIELVEQDLKVIWRRLLALLGENAARFEAELLLLLRDLDSEDSRDASAEVGGLIHRYWSADVETPPDPRIPTLLERTSTLSRYGESDADQGEADDVGGLESLSAPTPSPRHVLLPIWYATDRDHQPTESPSRRYGIDRSPPGPDGSRLNYGTAAVSIPDGHRKGRMESPKWYKLQFRENPALHITVQSVVESSHDGWMYSLQDAVAAPDAAGDPTDTSHDILIFVHGYRTNWADAIKRAAQFSYDLEFKGRTVAYTWPSQGKLLSYTVDENNAAWAAPHFTDLLRDILANSGARRVHIVAHSMGNRITTASLQAVADDEITYSTPVREVVFAAPDVDSDTFFEFVTAFNAATASWDAPRLPHLTLYACGVDSALDLSRRIHKLRRAGDTRDGIVVATPMDTIEVTQIVLEDDRDDGVGHAYFCSNRAVIADLNDLVLQGAAPPRFGLQPVDGNRYWRL
jgi:esterase/lipase superfamily enzyme